MDVAFPYKKPITKALRLLIALIDNSNNTRGEPVICYVEKAKNVHQLVATSLYYGQASAWGINYLFTLW